MKGIHRFRPRPALVLAVLALIAATAGTSYAFSQFGVGALREGARQKVVGVGKLVYVTTTTTVPVTTLTKPTTTVSATCPTAPIGNLEPIGGGIKLDKNDPALTVLDSHHIANGWEGTVYNNTAASHTAVVTLACARSIAVSGAALPAATPAPPSTP